MTQQEFQERVKMTVSTKEYEAIETVYLMSDLNKDDFCKMWVQMNRSRVDREAKKAKIQREIREQKEKAYKVFCKLETFIHKDFDNYCLFAHEFLGTRDQRFLESKLHFQLERMSVGQLKFELGRFIGIY